MNKPITTEQFHEAIEQFKNDILRIVNAHELFVKACQAAIIYDTAIQECVNDPEKMTAYGTGQGDTLDDLYADWITKSRAALAKVKVEGGEMRG